jgi:hypothetical protein
VCLLGLGLHALILLCPILRFIVSVRVGIPFISEL